MRHTEVAWALTNCWPTHGTLAQVPAMPLLLRNPISVAAGSFLNPHPPTLPPNAFHPAPQVSATHRLEDSKGEVERLQAAGGEIAQATVEDVPCGPIRIWPGGLAMGRTIGDAGAGDLVTAEPEICQVTIPASGARLLVGSDGLWDAILPKTAAHHCRQMGAAEAAHKLLALAIKADKLKDDVTGGLVWGGWRPGRVWFRRRDWVGLAWEAG